MNNNSSNNFPSDNNLITQYNHFDTNQINIINSDLNAPNPVSNPQIINPTETFSYNNNINSNEFFHKPNIQTQVNDIDTNITPKKDPYDQINSQTQEFPYYNITSEPLINNRENIGNNLSQNRKKRKCLIMVLIMPILMFIFLFCENRILSQMGDDYYNDFIIGDEIAILICAIIFLITFIFNNRIKNCIVNLRTSITSLVWFIGLIIRMLGSRGSKHYQNFKDFDEETDKESKIFNLSAIRTTLLFIAIVVSSLNAKKN